MPRPVGPRNTIVFAVGAVMMALGAYVGAHPLWSHGGTVTESRLLDLALTLFFLLRPGRDPIYYQLRDFRVERVIP